MFVKLWLLTQDHVTMESSSSSIKQLMSFSLKRIISLMKIHVFYVYVNISYGSQRFKDNFVDS